MKKSNSTTARQAQGFKFEEIIIPVKTGMTKQQLQNHTQTTNTAEWDIPTGKYKGVTLKNHSIKTFQKKGSSGTIYFGDAIRFYKATSKNAEPFTVIAGEYSSINGKKMVHAIYEIEIDPKQYNEKFWKNADYNKIVKVDEYIKKVPHGPGQRELHKPKYTPMITESYNGKKGIVTINPKLDSGKQRRLQTSITKKRLRDNGVVLTEYTTSYCGLTLPVEITDDSND